MPDPVSARDKHRAHYQTMSDAELLEARKQFGMLHMAMGDDDDAFVGREDPRPGPVIEELCRERGL